MNADLRVSQLHTAARPLGPTRASTAHPEEDDVEKILAASAALLASIDSATPTSPPAQRERERETALRSSKARRTNSTRERMQHELQFLRSHVAELEAELEGALLRAEQHCGSGCEVISRRQPIDNSSAVVARRSLQLSAWEQVAKRQRCVRTHSETVNGSLRQQVAEYVVLIRGIRELLLSHRRHQDRTVWQETRHNHLNGRAIHDQWVSSLWREWQQRDAQQAYARTIHKLGSLDTTPLISSPLLEETSTASVECERSTMRLLSRACSSHVFPFDVHATSNAAWPSIASIFDWHKLQSGDSVSAAAVGEAQMLGTTDFRVVERTPTTYAIQYTVTLGLLQQTDFNSECEQATVRAQERITYFPSAETPARTVLIWQTFIDTSTCTRLPNSNADADIEDKDPMRSPSLIHGTGWLILEKQPSSCSTSIMRTLFEFYVDESATSDPEAYDTAKKVVKTWIALGQACLHTAELEMDKRLLLH